MPAIVTNNFRTYSMNQFIESLTEPSPTNMYLFIGRPMGWDYDSSPDVPFDNEENRSQIWDDMMSLKRITVANTRPVIPRIDWKINTIYDEYRHNYSSTYPAYSGATNLSDARFYVVNDSLQVYKCISNNLNSPSTTQPSGNSLQIFTTPDGYRWKYMYTISTSDAQLFVTSNFIPVVTDPTVRSAATPGAINHVHVKYGGSSQIVSSEITFSGDGVDAEGYGIVESGRLVGVTMTNIGNGYHTASATMGTDVILEPVIEPEGGHGYNSVDELCSRYILLAVKLEYAESGDNFVVNNDYRRVGMIQDPLNYGTTTASTAATLSAMQSITFSTTIGDFVEDETITGQTSGAIADSVTYYSGIKTLKFLKNSTTGYAGFSLGETVVGSVSGATGVVDTINDADIEKFSGKIVYIDNRVPMMRTYDQIDYISIVIKF